MRAICISLDKPFCNQPLQKRTSPTGVVHTPRRYPMGAQSRGGAKWARRASSTHCSLGVNFSIALIFVIFQTLGQLFSLIRILDADEARSTEFHIFSYSLTVFLFLQGHYPADTFIRLTIARSLHIPDAAHGKTDGPAVTVQRAHDA